MRKYLVLYAVVVTAAFVFAVRHYRTENRRLTMNQHALLTDTEQLRMDNGRTAAEVEVLRLTVSELKRLRDDDRRTIRDLGIRLRDAQSYARATAQTSVEMAVPLRDTVIIRDTVRVFRWRDAWVDVEGQIRADSVECRVESIDTLHQVVWRERRRFLFIRWGTKSLRQRITSSNPHTRIVAAECIEIGN